MFPSTCPNGLRCPALDDVNARIRTLMGEPATPARAERYRLLLDLWGSLTRGNLEPAA
ncbi:hypothetical protein ABZT06_44390 [Streptomyces sp. NPDC005483]|uniref:hypothetical protein n=1 Tax=Streptomyces sp. NPDC005483 TaxID=3154882 RepID=UPI00339F5750